MERKIGEIFTYKGKTYKVIKPTYGCRGCTFYSKSCFNINNKGECYQYTRTDNINVIFKEIKSMEIKNNKLTINIPKGVVIDLEKSNLTKGIIKFKQNTTYEDIENTLKLDKNCASIIVNKNNIHKLCVISKLMNIAKYYNKDWKPDWSKQSESKYYIIYDNSNNTYTIDYNNSYTFNNIYFKNREDAIAVINNPNFKNILDNIYKN